MARPTKPAAILKMEGKSHKTKAEYALRERAEDAVLTGYKIAESDDVKTNPIAHAQFQRVTLLLDQIGKNDEMYGEPMRRYCLNKAELADVTAEIAKLEDKRDKIDNVEMELKLNNMILRLKQYAAQLKNSLDKYENDSGMTLASSLRMIPKKPEQVKDPILEILNAAN